jgi:hypothetical protein
MALRWSVLALGLFFVVLHSLVLPPHGFFCGDQGAKFLQARAFAIHGPLNPAIDVRAVDLDPGYRYQEPILRIRQGRLVATFSWLLPMLTAPFLILLGLRGLYVIPALSVVVIFLAAAALGRRLGQGCGLWTAWAAVLAAPVLVYGLELWEHAPAAACVTLVAVLLAPGVSRLRRDAAAGQRPRPGTGVSPPTRERSAFPWLRLESAPIRFLLAGAVAAAGSLFREEAGLALPAFVIARAIGADRDRWKTLVTAGLWAAAGAAAVFALTVPLNLAIYGSALPLHLTSEVAKTTPYWAMRREIAQALLVPSMTPQSLLLTWPFLFALVLLPWVAPEDARRPVVRFLALGGLLLVAGTLAIVPSPGGAQWSPRYLFVAAPVLAALASAPAWRASGSSARSAIIVGLSRGILLCSLGMQIVGVSYLTIAKARYARITNRLAALAGADGVVITDVPWFPEVTATLLPTHRILLAWSPAEVQEIAALAAARGFRDIAVVASVAETHYVAPGALDASAAGCVFTRIARLSFGERGLILHRYACRPALGVLK